MILTRQTTSLLLDVTKIGALEESKAAPGSQGNEAVTYKQLQEIEGSIPSSDEFYLTGPVFHLNGYVYSKGNDSGYYLGW